MKGKPDFVPEERYCTGVGKYCLEEDFCLKGVAKVDFPTRFSRFTLYGFFDSRQAREHTAIVRGDVAGRERVPLQAAGIAVADRIPVVIPANPHDQGYLDVKREKMGHMI